MFPAQARPHVHVKKEERATISTRVGLSPPPSAPQSYPPDTVTIPPSNFIVPPLSQAAASSGTDRNPFKLHKICALRRKARVKAGLDTDTDMSASASSLSIPASPSSSKRSRSRESTQSAASSVLAPSSNTPFFTPSAGAPNLVIPPTGAALAGSQPPAEDLTPYPAFLRLSKPEIHQKFVDLEWEQRKRLISPTQHTETDSSQWERCSGEDVVSRNRYANVDPYVNNRVRLKVPEGHNDYINASPVELKSTKSRATLTYIATQGPRFDTYSHFWRMIWNETTSPSVVVMLTKTHEAAREKCFPYYPRTTANPDLRLNANDEFEDGFTHSLKLASLEEHEEARASVRELDMTSEDGSEARKTWHLLFAGWPDFLVPEGDDRIALLKLIDMSREKNADNATNPRIVHCSAGVGRSGTFIALDWLLQELDDGSLDSLADAEDPILNVVDTLRRQRMMMVQSEAQLAFIYDVIRERWRDRWSQRHAEDAERMRVAHDREEGPQLKRQKSSIIVQKDGDEDERAQLEAELADAGMDFEDKSNA